jgi:monofunctional biosynthetic peptidoglycan transglycosylase
MKKLKFIVLIVLVIFAADIGRYFVYPDIGELKKTNPIPSAFMELKMKQWEEEGKKKQIVQKWVNIKQVSPYLIKAVLISEDDKFYAHEGFDIEAIESAIEKNIKSGQFSFGGSTISQQLSKTRILEIYLNVAQWGDNIFGIEAAAKHYFGKSASNLTAMEASRLAAVLPNPVLYNPTSNRKFVVNKSNRIYKIMQRRGIVEPEFKEVVTDRINAESKTEVIENQTADKIEDFATPVIIGE